MSYLICLLLTGAGSKRTFSLLNGESAVVLCCVVLCCVGKKLIIMIAMMIDV